MLRPGEWVHSGPLSCPHRDEHTRNPKLARDTSARVKSYQLHGDDVPFPAWCDLSTVLVGYMNISISHFHEPAEKHCLRWHGSYMVHITVVKNAQSSPCWLMRKDIWHFTQPWPRRSYLWLFSLGWLQHPLQCHEQRLPRAGVTGQRDVMVFVVTGGDGTKGQLSYVCSITLYYFFIGTWPNMKLYVPRCSWGSHFLPLSPNLPGALIILRAECLCSLLRDQNLAQVDVAGMYIYI